MIFNCSITSWKHAGIPKGDGRPNLGSELVPAANRPLVGSAVNPGSHAVQSASARSVMLDLVVSIPATQLVRFGIVPAIGDRLTVKMAKPGAMQEVRVEITDEKPDVTTGVLGAVAVTTFGVKRVEDGV